MGSVWKPVKYSPVHHLLVNGGAVLTEVAGWLDAAHFGNAEEEARAVRSGVGISDLSSAPKSEIKGAYLSEFLAAFFGETPEPGGAIRASSGTLCRVSRHHVLLIMDQAEALPPPQLAEDNSVAGCIHVTDRTSGLGNFLLCGPFARDVLRKVTSLDLREARFPDLSCACGPMAAIQVLVFRRDRGGLPAYEVLFSREYGEYLWAVLIEAGDEFHLRPLGFVAAQILEQ